MAILTTFGELWDGFSLCQVARTQLRYFLAEGRETTFVACDGFVPSGVFADPRIAHGRIPYAMLPGGDQQPDGTWFARQVADVRAALRPIIAATDVAITHDLMLLNQNLAYNAACRHLAAEFPAVRWLHWIHSAPAGPVDAFPPHDPRSLLASPPRNGRFVYPNRADAHLLATRYGVLEQEIAVVPHPFDHADEFDMDSLSIAIADRLDLWSADIVCLYPGRIDPGKQVYRVVQLLAALKARGASVRLVIAGFHALASHQDAQRAQLHAEAARRGLHSRELTFIHDLASDLGHDPRIKARLTQELPHKVVMDLFRLATIYVHPSVCETYSLVTQEAAASGALLVLNDDDPAMREIYGDAALWFSFGGRSCLPDHPDGEETFLACSADAILSRLESDPIFRQRRRLRQRFNPAALFRAHLSPLLDPAPLALAGAA